MAALIFPHRWRRQPSAPVGIDWSHPLARGLRHVWLCGAGQNRTRCLVTGTQLVNSGGPFFSTDGVGFGNAFAWSATLSKSFAPPATFVVGLLYTSDSVTWSVGPSSPAWTGYYIQNSGYQPVSTNSTDFSGADLALVDGLQYPLATRSVNSIAFTMSGANDLRGSRNGGPVSQDTACAAPSGTLNTMRIGLSPNASNYGTGELAYCFALDVSVSDADLRALSANPWQLLAPLPRRLHFFGAGAGGGTTASLAATEVGSDAAVAGAAVRVAASLARQESGADTAAIAGAVRVSAALARAESGPDAAAFSAGVRASASLAATESGKDTLAASVVAPTGRSAYLAAAEIGADAAAVGAGVRVAASTSSTEANRDAAAANAGVRVASSLAATEVGKDTMAATSGRAAALAATETGKDAAAAAATVRVSAAATAVEAADGFAGSMLARVRATAACAEITVDAAIMVMINGEPPTAVDVASRRTIVAPTRAVEIVAAPRRYTVRAS